MGCGCGVVYRNYSGGVEIGFLSDYKRDRCIKPLVIAHLAAYEYKREPEANTPACTHAPAKRTRSHTCRPDGAITTAIGQA